MLNNLLDQGGNLRRTIPLWALVGEHPRRLSALIFFIFPAGAWSSPHSEYPMALNGTVGILIKLLWLEANKLFPPLYITMFTHQGSIFNLSLLIKACHHSPLVRSMEEEMCLWAWA